jgi:HD-GYP domain-containing protein (c-di-GMP phosphodiesterase class II)
MGDELFIPIPLSSLRLDTITGFDLYIRMRENEEPILYAQRDVPFTEKSRRRIMANAIRNVYITTDQRQEYKVYIEKNLQYALQDPGVSTKDKSALLYATSKGFLDELIEDPYMPDGLPRSRMLVNNLVHFIFNNSMAVRQFLELSSQQYTPATHCVNTCILGLATAKRLGIRHPKQLNHFATGALLRDVGLAKIDSSITKNPGKLTLGQYEVIKTHPVESEEILRDLGGLNDLELDMIRHHHERMNGSGYPDGLEGNEINQMARILGVVDVFDALTTDRPFQLKLSSFEALRKMAISMRDEFDLSVFQTFIGMMGNPR